MDVRVHYIQIEFRRKRKERDEITQKKKSNAELSKIDRTKKKKKIEAMKRKTTIQLSHKQQTVILNS